MSDVEQEIETIGRIAAVVTAVLGLAWLLFGCSSVREVRVRASVESEREHHIAPRVGPQVEWDNGVRAGCWVGHHSRLNDPGSSFESARYRAVDESWIVGAEVSVPVWRRR